MSESSGTRAATTAAVLLVAAIAAVVSFVHIEHLAVTHGQTRLAAASLVMLRTARAGLGTPWLARVMLGLSVVATLAANIAYGAHFGVTGSLLSGWPAVAFIGSAEMAIGMVRRARSAPGPEAVPAVPAVPEAVSALNGHGHEAERLFAGEIEAGDIPSIRRIRAALHVGQPRAREVQAHLEKLTPAGRSIARLRNEIRQGAEVASTP